MKKEIGIGINISSKDAAKRLGEVEQKLARLNQTARDAKKSGKVSADSFGRIRKAQIDLQETAKGLRKELRDQAKAFQSAKFPTDSILGLKQRYRELFREIQGLSKADPRFNEKSKEAAALSNEINRLSKRAGAFKDNIGRYAEDLGPLFNTLQTGLAAGFGAIFAGNFATSFAEGAAQITESIEKIRVLRGEVQQLTQTGQAEGDRITARIQSIADAFNLDAQEVLIASNSLTKQLTGDFEESFNLIEKGLLAGGNANGEFLDCVKEYPAFFREAGASGEQFISTITQGVQEGVFSDKSVDLLKEFNLRIRELTPVSQKALEQIGISSQEIQRVVQEEGVIGAFDLVQERLEGFRDDAPEVGAILADVFAGPGEDAGIQFIRGLDLSKTSLEDLADTSSEYLKQQQAQLEAQKELSTALVELSNVSGGYIARLKILGTQVLTQVLQGFIAFLNALKEIPTFLNDNKVALGALAGGLILMNKNLIVSSALTLKDAAVKKGAVIATNAQVVAQRALNFVLRANPIGIVITALGLLAVAFKTAYDRSAEFRAIVAGSFAVLKEFAEIAKESFSNFLGIFSDLGEGNFKGAFERFKTSFKQSNPIGFFMEQGGRLKGAFKEGYTNKLGEEISKGTEEEITKAGPGLEKAGEKAGDKAGEGFNKGLSQAAATSLDGLNAKLTKLQEQLNRAPNADAYSDYLAKIRQVQQAIDITTASFIRFDDARLGLTASLTAIDSTSEGATNEQLLGSVISTLDLEAQAEQSRVKQNEEAINAIKASSREENLKKRKEQFDRELQAETEFREAQQAITSEAFASVGDLVSNFISDQDATFRDFLKGLVLSLLDALEKTILMLTVEAQAKAVTSQAGVPGAGLALGLAKAALVTGVIKGIFGGIKSSIQSFYTGGVVQGLPDYSNGGRIANRANIPVQPGGDRVFATLKPGEMVLTEGQQEKVKGMAGLDIFSRAGVPGASLGGAIVTPQLVNPNTAMAAAAPGPARLDPEEVRRQGDLIANTVGAKVYASVLKGYQEARQREERFKALKKNIGE